MTKIKLHTENLTLYYGANKILDNINIEISSNKITALIGPSGCGKSSFIRSLNRINDEIEGFHLKGKIFLEEQDIYDKKIRLNELRKKIGMVFQRPNPFPMSIYQNIAYGVKLHNLCKNKKELDDIVINSLELSGLYEEVKDKLHHSALTLSGGQQQRLCIARSIAIEPEILLMDEPTSALDPVSTSIIENLMINLESKFTIILVTHSMQQASRVSEFTGVFYKGGLVEFDKTKKIFTNPSNNITEKYISGRFT